MKIRDLRYPLIIAHRGYSLRYPENTLIAFEKAIASDVQMIELDVTLTRDRKLVVIHDETLERTTNGRGRVADHTLLELKRLDAGGWFSERFSGETIPTLTEVLTLVAGRAAVNIEIKPEAYEADHPEDAVERQIRRLLQDRHLAEDVLISSFEPRVLAQFAAMRRPPALAYLTDDPGVAGDAADRTGRRIFDVCQKIDAFSWNPDYRCLNPARLAKAHAMGLRVLTYTVNAVDQSKRLIEMGVDGIFADDPAAAENGLEGFLLQT